MKTTINLDDLADAFCSCDTAAIKKDVLRLGSVREAAVYCAELAADQEYYAPLSSGAGRVALRKTIAAIVS